MYTNSLQGTWDSQQQRPKPRRLNSGNATNGYEPIQKTTASFDSSNFNLTNSPTGALSSNSTKNSSLGFTRQIPPNNLSRNENNTSINSLHQLPSIKNAQVSGKFIIFLLFLILLLLFFLGSNRKNVFYFKSFFFSSSNYA